MMRAFCNTRHDFHMEKTVRVAATLLNGSMKGTVEA